MKPPPYLSKSQVRRLRTVAANLFDRLEDQKDFLQTAYLVAWERALDKGLRPQGDRTYILDIQYVILEAKRMFLAAQRGRTDSRPSERLLSEDWETAFDRFETQTLGQMTDGMCPPVNARDWARERRWRLYLDDGRAMHFSYEELAELRKADRHSIIASRSRNMAMKFWVFNGRLFLGTKEVAKAGAFSIYQAKKVSKTVTLKWAEEQGVS